MISRGCSAIVVVPILSRGGFRSKQGSGNAGISTRFQCFHHPIQPIIPLYHDHFRQSWFKDGCEEWLKISTHATHARCEEGGGIECIAQGGRVVNVRNYVGAEGGEKGLDATGRPHGEETERMIRVVGGGRGGGGEGSTEDGEELGDDFEASRPIALDPIQNLLRLRARPTRTPTTLLRRRRAVRRHGRRLRAPNLGNPPLNPTIPRFQKIHLQTHFHGSVNSFQIVMIATAATATVAIIVASRSSAGRRKALAIVASFQFHSVQSSQCRHDLETLGHGDILAQTMD
mmetsp:Transcript_33729/g.57308  ORF Transcript_33729/g.57308 Transcript_33729/m.57308 type:complete len:287 (+) Transcript_33729:908-1768(+)